MTIQNDLSLEEILQRELSKAPIQINLLRKYFLKQYFSSMYTHSEMLENIDKCIFNIPILSSKQIGQTEQLFYAKNINFSNTYTFLQKIFPKEHFQKYNLLLLFFIYINQEYSEFIDTFLAESSSILLSKGLTPKLKTSSKEDKNFLMICDSLILIFHHMLLDTFLLEDYSHISSKPNAVYEKYENEIKENVLLPSLSQYYYIEQTKEKLEDDIYPQFSIPYGNEFEIFPAIFTLCMNRGITEIQATSKDPTKQYQSFIKRIPLDTKPNIDYLSAILANPIKSNHKNIQRNNRLRFQKKEIQEFRKICKNVNNLQDNNEFLKSKKQYILKKYFGEFPKISTSNISSDDVKPLILLCKDNFKFTLQYEYFESFINICNLNTKFNKPLSLLHLNLYTHWIDACFIAKYFPHHLCIYSGLYLKSLYCNKGFNTLLKNFFNHKLMNALKDIGSYFFTILPNNILKNYYSSCKENEVLMNFLNHPKENTFIYEEENTYYHNCWEPPTSNFSSHPLVELYDWILEMENEEDINYLYKIYF